MTTLANVKGYINGNQRGVFLPIPPSPEYDYNLNVDELFNGIDWNYISEVGIKLIEGIDLSAKNPIRDCEGSVGGSTMDDILFCLLNDDLASYIYDQYQIDIDNGNQIGYVSLVEGSQLIDDSNIETVICEEETPELGVNVFLRIKYNSNPSSDYGVCDIQRYEVGELNGNLINECEPGFNNLIIAFYRN